MPLSDFIEAIRSDTSLRVQVLYFPGRLAEKYKLSKDEIEAVKTGNFANIKIQDADAEWLRKLMNYDGL